MWTIRSVRSAASVLCLLLGESLLLSGCKEDLFTPTLSTDRQSVELLWDGSDANSGVATCEVKVYCPTSYTYTCDANWVQISATQDSYSSVIKISTTINMEPTTRSASLYLTSAKNLRGETAQQTIRITQQGVSHRLIDENKIELSSKAVSDYPVSVNYSGGWRVTSSDADWLKASPKYNYGGNGGYYLALSAETNLSTQPREATVIISTTDLSGSQYSEPISVTQQGASHGFIDENKIELSSEAVTDRVVAVNYSGSWRATCNVGWLEVNRKYDYSNGGYYLALSAETNLSMQPREATVTVSTTYLSGSQYTETISVTQLGTPDDIASQIDNIVLRTALAEQCGTPGQVLRSKLEPLTSLDLSAAAGQNIGSIDKILSYCSNLQHLTCKDLSLTTLNLSPLKQLQTLNCSGNRLTSLSNLPTTLTRLNCSDNRLTSLSSFPSGLTELNCSYNQLSSLDVITLSYLTVLDCSHNNIRTSYLNVGYAPVETLDCSYNQLTSLLVNSTRLQTLNCSYNNFSSHLSLTNFRSLKKLDCSGNNGLRTVSINSAALPTLEYTKDPATQIY